MAMSSFYVGTSGWSYPSGYGKWAGVFYPKRWRGDELAYYAERFPAVEVNVTFYRIPTADVARGWIARTPTSFQFAVKAFRKFTHPIFFAREEGKSPEITPDDIHAMRAVLDPLANERRLGALLVQYADNFRKNRETLSSLLSTLEYFRDYPLAVELRHPSWGDAETKEALAQYHATRVRIDEPFFQNLNEPIDTREPFLYWRFHGRNAQEWRKPGAGARRYDYLYTKDEIGELAHAIQREPERGKAQFAFFNNHVQGQAVANALFLAKRLELDLAYEKFANMTDQFPELRDIIGNIDLQLPLM